MPGQHVTGIVADASSWTGSMCTTLQRDNGEAGLVRVVEHLNGVHDSACKDTGALGRARLRALCASMLLRVQSMTRAGMPPRL